MKINFADVKRALSACHLNAKERDAKFMLDVESNYITHRVLECMNKLEQGKDEEGNLQLAIQLLAVRYAKLLKAREEPKPKIKKSKDADTNSDPTPTPTVAEAVQGILDANKEDSLKGDDLPLKKRSFGN